MTMQGMAAMMAGMEDMVVVTVDTGKPHLFAFLLLSRLGYRLLLPTHFPCRASPPGSSWSLSPPCLGSSSHCFICSDPNDALLAAQAANDAAMLDTAVLNAQIIAESQATMSAAIF
jgi:hypothetical protein